ncbi:Transferrin family [Corchorus olitorius]|uniref:Transferrin family n=1 Tax=Corchorus olitorius TaxID=93759 RepID=A0A1R3IF75_9ROSI|nr:Transferrin family [Corchorus olitorius]
MEISSFLPFFLILFFSALYTVQGINEPSPAPSTYPSLLAPESASSHSLAPDSGETLAPDNGSGGTLAPSNDLSPPSPKMSLPPSLAPVPMMAEKGGEADAAPAPEMEGSKSFEGIGPSSDQEMEEAGEQMVRWCTVRQEFEDCQLLIRSMDQSNGYTWKCIQMETAQECLESIKRGEADLINLEAGLAYTAFVNYSMKAIANEVYCNHAKSYQAVAVVNRNACKQNKGINLMDFKGHKSCHGGYSTAAGWNYPINHIKESLGSQKLNDREIAAGFFSKICAPSEFEGSGICSGCGNENGSCYMNSPYFGHLGALRCLMEELGDIAFVKADTVLLYSMEGPYNQSWSSKSIRDFMYLCPDGGCREINDYPGSCSFGAVPANVIMASNSLPNKKRLIILEILTNGTLVEALNAGKYGASPLLSPSTQEIAVIKQLTRCSLSVIFMWSEFFSDQTLFSPNNDFVTGIYTNVEQRGLFHSLF